MKQYISYHDAIAITLQHNKTKAWLDEQLNTNTIFWISSLNKAHRWLLNDALMYKLQQPETDKSSFISSVDYEITKTVDRFGNKFYTPVLLLNDLVLFDFLILPERLNKNSLSTGIHPMFESLHCNVGACGAYVEIEVTDKLFIWKGFYSSPSEKKEHLLVQMFEPNEFDKVFVNKDPIKTMPETPAATDVMIVPPLYFTLEIIMNMYKSAAVKNPLIQLPK